MKKEGTPGAVFFTPDEFTLALRDALARSPTDCFPSGHRAGIRLKPFYVFFSPPESPIIGWDLIGMFATFQGMTKGTFWTLVPLDTLVRIRGLARVLLFNFVG